MSAISVRIEGNLATAVSPEGARSQLKIADLLGYQSPAEAVEPQLLMPQGGLKFFSRGRLLVLLHQTPPRVCTLKWISEQSAVPYGEGAEYRDARIALPYVVVMAVFECSPSGSLSLSMTANECFFSNSPLTRLDQPLCYPALLNCSRFSPPDGHPLSWICTQFLQKQRSASHRGGETDANAKLRSGLKALLHCLFETGFNYSSEHHEASSWFSESMHVDQRIASIAAWEKATARDAHFVLEVPWLQTELTTSQIVERIFLNHGLAHRAKFETAEDVARVIFNRRRAK